MHPNSEQTRLLVSCAPLHQKCLTHHGVSSAASLEESSVVLLWDVCGAVSVAPAKDDSCADAVRARTASVLTCSIARSTWIVGTSADSVSSQILCTCLCTDSVLDRRGHPRLSFPRPCFVPFGWMRSGATFTDIRERSSVKRERLRYFGADVISSRLGRRRRDLGHFRSLGAGPIPSPVRPPIFICVAEGM